MKTKNLLIALITLIIVSALYTNLHTPQGPDKDYQHPTINNK